MTSVTTSKEELLRALAELPAEDLEVVRQFVDFLRFKTQNQRNKIVQLGGLWRDFPPVTEEDIRQVRREMWGSFGDRNI